MQMVLLRALALAALLPALSHADAPGSGWGHDATAPLGNAFAAYDILSSGNRLAYDGQNVWIETDAGVLVQTLGTFPTMSFASFVEADPTETFAVFGESTSGSLYRVDLVTGGPTFLATVLYAYDLVYENANSALVSAADSSFTSNHIVRVDLTSGVTSPVADVSGPSGPIALSSAGDLYYAVQPLVFPTPPGSVSVIRWTANQLANGPLPLSESQASVFANNFDGGAALAFDPVFGNLFLSVPGSGGPSTIVEIDRFGARVGVVAITPDTSGRIEIVDAPSAGACSAYQPAGRALRYRATDYATTFASRFETVSPRRPQLRSVQNPDNTMTCALTGGVPNASALVISGNLWQYGTTERDFDLGTHLFWTGLPFNAIRRAGIVFATDAQGTGSFTFNNPPNVQGLFVIQALVRDAAGIYRGTSTAAFN